MYADARQSERVRLAQLARRDDTAQNTVIQATRNPIVAKIPLWSGTSVAASSAREHTQRVGIAFTVLGGHFVAAWKANH